jgi:predicted dehydrogenase
MTHPVGIIGLGMIGEKVLREFLDHPSFAVLACWDINPIIRDQVQLRHPDAPIVGDDAQVFDQHEIELVYVATPPATHVEYGLKTIERNYALFMEKPLSIDLKEGERLVESAEVKGIRTAMNFGYGAGPVVDAMEELIAGGEIGNIHNIQIRYQFPSWPLPNQLSAANWIIYKNTGGFIREMFSHQVYLIHRLFGPLRVDTVEVAYPAEGNSAEDFAIAKLYSGDIPVWFMGGMGSPHAPRTSDFTIHGELGVLRIGAGHQLFVAEGGVWQEVSLNTNRSSMEARLDQLAARLEGEDNQLPTLRDGFEVQKVIERMLK